jgi:hypothetical protein
MANLYVTITEEITLPNQNLEKTYNLVTIPNINQIVRRIDTIPTTFSGSGVEILRFVNSEEEQTGGAFVKSSVKYIRLTNLSKTNSAEIYLIVTGQESTLLNLNAGKSIMLNDIDINASSTFDYVIEDYVDSTYYSTYKSVDSIKAKASGSNISLEYFVASL